MKNKILHLSIIIILINTFNVLAQTTKEEIFETPEKAGGVYFAYPVNEITKQTPAPKGYEPFYISHFGRHGSRYLINDSDYKIVLDVLEDANNNKSLTTLGLDVYTRLKEVWNETEYRGGDLSKKGINEQRGIAKRMFDNYPQVFVNNGNYNACATTVVRCVLSMDAFCEQIKELKPSLTIERNSGMKWQRYLNHHTKEAIEFRSAEYTWREAYRKFEQKHVQANSLINSLFNNQSYIDNKVNPEDLMWRLFNIAIGMQNIETKVSFFDIFNKQELFDLWQCKNYKLYVNDANASINKGLMLENSKPVLKNIIDQANKIIKSNSKGADLRFAHDGNIIPLALLLHLDKCYNSELNAADYYKAWCDFKVAPMAGNIQMIFYKDTSKTNSNDILVKFLLHEKEIKVPLIQSDILPYYYWRDVEKFYLNILNLKPGS